MNGAIAYWVRSAFWSRRRAALVLALLTVLATVVPLVAAAAARRTATSVDRMQVELRPYHLDLQFEAGPPPADVLARIESLPGVEMVAEGASILARPLGADTEFGQSFGQGGLDDQLGRDFERARLDDGRPPSAPDEVMLSRKQAALLGMEVGDTLVIETISPEGIERVFSGEPPEYDGPQVPLHIVGVGRQPEDLTAGADFPAPQFVVAPSFFDAWAGRVHWFDGIFLVRLEGGVEASTSFTEAARTEFPDREDLVTHPSEEAARIGDAVSTQTIALALLAAAALVTGALAVAQAAIRMARSAESDAAVLIAMGLDGRQLALARSGLVGAPVLLGAMAAVVLAVVASPLFPTGPAGRVEPEPGVRIDVLALGGGALIVVVTALTATLLARHRSRPTSARPARLGDLAARSVRSVAAAVGIRGALRRDRGAEAASTYSAMVALGLGVAGTVGSLVFASSLTRLVDAPPRYGWNWDYELALGDELTDEDALRQAREVVEDPRIDGALYARLATKELQRRSTVVYGVEPLAADLQTTIVEGQTVRADDEIVMGQTTLEEFDVRVGGTLALDGLDGPIDLRIVGKGLFPANEIEDPAGSVMVTLATFHRLPGSDGFPDMFITVAPGTDVAALRADLEGAYGATTGAVAPPVIGNLDLVDQAPYLLAAYLGLLGAAAAIHAAVVTARQRRNELATLRAIGFDRRQVAVTVLAQSATIGVVGLAVGFPLGLAAGRLTWRLVADGLGFASDPRNPFGALLATGPGVVALALLIGTVPAIWSVRQRPATILRTE